MSTSSEKRRRKNINYVQQDGTFKEVMFKEESTRKNWDRNWGFLEDYAEMFKQELARSGITSEPPRPRDWIFKTHVPEPAPSPPFPVTSAGMIGWRASKPECNLEKFGPLHNPPKLPPPEP